jgi:hypothetical protein
LHVDYIIPIVAGIAWLLIAISLSDPSVMKKYKMNVQENVFYTAFSFYIYIFKKPVAWIEGSRLFA